MNKLRDFVKSKRFFRGVLICLIVFWGAYYFVDCRSNILCRVWWGNPSESFQANVKDYLDQRFAHGANIQEVLAELKVAGATCAETNPRFNTKLYKEGFDCWKNKKIFGIDIVRRGIFITRDNLQSGWMVEVVEYGFYI